LIENESMAIEKSSCARVRAPLTAATSLQVTPTCTAAELPEIVATAMRPPPQGDRVVAVMRMLKATFEHHDAHGMECPGRVEHWLLVRCASGAVGGLRLGGEPPAHGLPQMGARVFRVPVTGAQLSRAGLYAPDGGTLLVDPDEVPAAGSLVLAWMDAACTRLMLGALRTSGGQRRLRRGHREVRLTPDARIVGVVIAVEPPQ
jgi:hypothetical protein